jgi:hypothetical protein
MGHSAVVMGIAMVVMAGAVHAQEKPDFSGKWTVDAEKTAADRPPGNWNLDLRGGTSPLMLTLDATSLTTEHDGQQGVQKVTYRLDGSTQNIAMGQQQVPTKAAWLGNTIVIEQTRSMQGNTIMWKTTYALDGDYLVVTMSWGVGGESMERRTYYRK